MIHAITPVGSRSPRAGLRGSAVQLTLSLAYTVVWPGITPGFACRENRKAGLHPAARNGLAAWARVEGWAREGPPPAMLQPSRQRQPQHTLCPPLGGCCKPIKPCSSSNMHSTALPPLDGPPASATGRGGAGGAVTPPQHPVAFLHAVRHTHTQTPHVGPLM